MRNTMIILCLLVLISPLVSDKSNRGDWPLLKGPYLGQKPPGMKAEVFAPGIVSTNKNESLLGFFDNGNILLFSRTNPGFDDWKNEPFFIMEMKQGIWNRPLLSPHIGKPWYLNLKPFPPGKTLYFARWGGKNGQALAENLDIWLVKATENCWEEPRKLPFPINSDTIDTCPSVSKNGTLFFFSGRKGGEGRDDIYRSRLIDGKHLSVENLGPAINSIYHDIDPLIAPDESYLIFCSKRPDGYGEIDMYISFHKKDGSWTPPVNLGQDINSSAYDWIPFISEDERYLFFTSNRSGHYDIYWVDAKIIKILKLNVIN
jgi:hypothetical protein